MSAPVIVLKFGGSVLDGDAALRRAADEVYRWRRDGWRVVAVVSALAGRTGELLAQGAQLAGSSGSAPSEAAAAATALLVAQGEFESAALLGLCCERAGVGARVVAPAEIGLRAQGEWLEARPAHLDEAALARVLDEAGVAIVPGFVGLDERGSLRLFGRGGSDLTALFVAARLAARCRLVKDVDGLYEFDPRAAAGGSRAPRRFAELAWEHVGANLGQAVQEKALAWARAERIAFEVASANALHCTSVGAASTRQAGGRPPRARLRVALLGLGTVGAGVAERLRDHADAFEIKAACARNVAGARARLPWLAARIAGSALAALQADVDVVVELLGDVPAAHEAIRLALGLGMRVVTANKRVLARDGAELARLASGPGRLLASAAVGGSMPLVERASARAGLVRGVAGVLNGTANYVLSRAADGADLARLVAGARSHGFTERDARRDLDGRDAADKLCVLARALGQELSPAAVAREPIDASALAAAERARRAGLVLRQVARIEIPEGAGRCAASVRLEPLDPHGPLALLALAQDEQNAAVIELRDGTRETLRGRGAGRWPTAQSVVGDLLALARGPSGRRSEVCA